MRKRKDAKKEKIKKTAFLTLICFMACSSLMYWYKNDINPILDEISMVRAKAIITDLINDTMDKNVIKNERKSKLFIFNKNKNGEIQAVQGNTEYFNKYVAKFSTKLQKDFDNLKESVFLVPLGSILGSKWMSQIGGNFKIRILPLSVSSCSYDSNFTSEGINQTKYQVYLKVKSEVRVMKPFSQKKIEIKSKILIAETVIVGKVPNSYVKVPKENILDVTDE